MNYADALTTIYNAIRYADRWVDENDPVADIRGLVEKYLADYGFDDEVMTVVTTARNLLDAAAGRGDA